MKSANEKRSMPASSLAMLRTMHNSEKRLWREGGRCMKQLVLFAMLLSLDACAHTGSPTQKEIEEKGKQFSSLSSSKSVAVLNDPYVGVSAVPIKDDEKSAASLNTHVTLRQHGRLADIAATISDMTDISVQIGADPAPLANSGGKSGSSPDGASPLPDALSVPSALAAPIQISYEGPLKGLLDQLAIASGYGWDFDEKTMTVVFSRLMVRTFAILGAPGKRSYKDQITNMSKEKTQSSIGGSNVNSTVSTSDTSSQTNQTNTTDFSFDIWADTEKAIKGMLSKEGSVVSNQAAGTITVRDYAQNVRQVGAYIAETNKRLSRQVALTVHVWALEVNDANEAGLELQALFANDDVSIVAGGALTALNAASTASATIISGKLKSSSGVLKALKEYGNATQVTSGGGLVLSNQPIPIQAIKRIAYLAGSSVSNNEYGQTTEITPGEVTTGFAMTLIPNILDRRRVMLQYTINLSSLDELSEFSTSDLKVQLPRTSSRAFSQRSTLQMGQTLILAGFQDQAQQIANSLGLFKLGRSADFKKTILVVTIEVEAAGGGTED